ncbi:probable E3 ubiquitin-protein ligase xerico [Phtheirospermum japonicum]|uniref:Probable E3 ubiquitin-protein ligase xerico n=1 Tax=Phtheirospermum japonicum TaxID=374723 RepID=A0A830CQB4_9LAMI|nr:probable E3 ubiquitin-protein ligase xerico [Phtheirospermum japonicum]
MGLPNFPSPAEGVLPMLVMNTVKSVALVKNKIRSVLNVGGSSGGDQDSDDEYSGDSRERRVSITRYGSLCRNRCSGDWPPAVECCVCLCRFEAEEEVSELSCKHVFHRGCLDKWFDNQHITCPLCRSIT